jgi:hypothetical protein
LFDLTFQLVSLYVRSGQSDEPQFFALFKFGAIGIYQKPHFVALADRTPSILAVFTANNTFFIYLQNIVAMERVLV